MRRTRVVQFSGGITSWATARRVADRHGVADLVLLFADTQIEDADLYAFVTSSAAQLGAPLVRVADGRTPWQVFEDKRRLGNSLLAPCSSVLKILPCRRWLTTNTDPARTVLYVGLDGSPRDRRRAPAIERGWDPRPVEFPLLNEPEVSKADLIDEARALGLRPPHAYELGFDHANFNWTSPHAGWQQRVRYEHLRRIFSDTASTSMLFNILPREIQLACQMSGFR